MRYVITGGAGFIGSHLCQKLLEDSKVICVDNLSSGTQENIKTLLKYKDFTFMDRDVRDAWKIKGKVDQIYSLASRASPVDFTTHALDIMTSNALGTINMLNLAKENKSKLLYASSSEVYGDPKEHPQTETYWGNVNPNGPRACYDEGKRFSEALVSSFPGVTWTIVRIFNTYGPYMNKNDGRAVPNFVNQAINNSPITVYGDGNQTRSFCYVSDMIEGIERAMFSAKSDQEVINLGNPNDITMLQLTKIIIDLTGSKSKIIFKQMPTDDPSRRRPDISKAKIILGWEPRVNIEDGMRATIDYFRA